MHGASDMGAIMTTPTPSIDELAKAAVAAGDEFEMGAQSSSWREFREAVSPQAILSLSSRVENARREALEDVIKIMLNATLTKTHAETLEAIRKLLTSTPGDTP